MFRPFYHFLLTISVICLFAADGFSQNREQYNLLWEIQHKDDDRKSFLFGTAHLRDERVFDFSDAVIPSIQSAESFALEIHPDSIGSGISKELFHEGYGDVYERILTKEERAQLDDKLLELTGKTLDSFEFKNPLFLEEELYPDVRREGDKNTFLDGYLYRVAKSLDKEVLGLEKVEDQIPPLEDLSDEELKSALLTLLNFDPQEYIESREDIIKLYYEGNVERLSFSIYGFGDVDSVMVRRNTVMVESLEKIMKDRTVFAAVGAAHIPGSEGIVNMLRERGYTVNKVPAAFTGISKNYKIKPNLKNWFELKDDSLGYSVQVPSKPFPMDFRGMFDIQMATDISTGGNFFVMAIDLRKNATSGETDDFVDIFLKNQLKGDTTKLLSREKIMNKGIPFEEVFYRSDDQVIRMQLAARKGILYSFYAQNEESELRSESIDAFFDSVRISEPIPMPIDEDWKDISNSIAAYEAEFPGRFTDMSQTVDNPADEEAPYEVSLYVANDPVNDANYFIRYNDQPLGYYVENEELIIEELKKNFESRGSIINSVEQTRFEDRSEIIFDLTMLKKYHTLAKAVIRGNRTYFVMAQSTRDTLKMTWDNPFLASFALQPYSNSRQDTLISLKDFSLSFPKNHVRSEETLDSPEEVYTDDLLFHGRNDNTGGTYLAEHIKMQKFFRVSSAKSYYELYTESLQGWEDSLTYQKEILIDGLPGWELELIGPKTNIIKRARVLLDGQGLYLLMAYVGLEEIQSGQVDDFFNSFRREKDTDSFDPYASKAREMLKGLRSEDTTVFAKSYYGLDYHEFDKGDIPELIKALSYSYSNDTLSNGAKNIIIEELASMDEEHILEHFEQLYYDPDTGTRQLQKLLEVVPSFSSQKAWPLYLRMLSKRVPERETYYGYYVMDAAVDSTEAFIAHIDKMMALVNIDNYRDDILKAADKIIQYDPVNAPMVKQYTDQLLKYVLEDTQGYVKNSSENRPVYVTYWMIRSYLDLIRNLGVQSSKVKKTLALLRSSENDDTGLRTKAVSASLALGFKVDEAVILELLKNRDQRLAMMEGLLQYGKKALIPSEYLDPVEFARLTIYDEVSYYDDFEGVITPLGPIELDGLKYHAFSYSDAGSENDEVPEKYLIVSTVKVPSETDHTPTETYTNWDIVSSDWKTQAKTLIKEHIEQD